MDVFLYEKVVLTLFSVILLQEELPPYQDIMKLIPILGKRFAKI